MSKKQEIIGLIDADLLDNGTRQPNLHLLQKIKAKQDDIVYSVEKELLVKKV